MLSRSTACRGAQRVARQQAVRPATQRRGLAAPASGSFQYQAGEANGVKYASRDFAGPTTTLALVAKAGTRFQLLPGLTEGLANFAFRGTERRSTLRIVRESELLGATLSAHHSRENLVLEAKFLRDDLPYFVELLGEVASSTKYQPHIYNEEVLPLIHLAHQRFLADVTAMATNSAHSLAFHRGLGVPTASSSTVPYTKYLDAHTIEYYSKIAYAKPNFAVVANGAEHGEFSKWVSEFFEGVPSSAAAESSVGAEQSKYYGGEERIAHAGGNAMVIGFPGSSSFTGKFYKPELAVLSSLLGGQSAVKWSQGFTKLANAAAPGAKVTTTSAIYSDAGLLYTTITGSAKAVAATAEAAVQAIQKVAAGEISSEEFSKAKAAAKFKELENGQDIRAGLELTGNGLIHNTQPYQIDDVAKAVDGVSEEAVKKAAKQLLESRASVSSVGDLFVLPYAADIGLKV
ncbi:ubiquinol-cytochrome C reductase complex core protein-like protein 2 [Plenodomus tracheiphilus IPT5]|uniref:Cytochrome b-c1 complex subunit 2, mitochondrial n=1 Tax=Plenodomus tracheiphilus IPT5 TaxID=1408161 RepID=A0A6A7BL56_9PLEO|nr:ubiquinol-cytochrome C reductase complex core protein-like protein 2 [Plenodomus tracheiphilus IPT5]